MAILKHSVYIAVLVITASHLNSNGHPWMRPVPADLSKVVLLHGDSLFLLDLLLDVLERYIVRLVHLVVDVVCALSLPPSAAGWLRCRFIGLLLLDFSAADG